MPDEKEIQKPAQEENKTSPESKVPSSETRNQKPETSQASASQTPAQPSAPAGDYPRRRELHWAIAHVFSSKNNTLITVTDISGSETIAKASGGMVVKAAREEGKPYAAMQATAKIVNECRNRGINALHVRIRAPGGHGAKTPGAGAQAVVRSMARMGIKIGKIEDVTPVPSDTTKRPWGRRGRRV